MSVLGTGFKALFLLTSASSAIGFGVAKTLHRSNGPSKRIADFSVFMAYSLGLYLLSCLALSFSYAAAREGSLAVVLLLSFCLPFILAFLARSYNWAETVFILQIVGLILGALSMVCLDPRVKQALLRLI